MDLRLWGPVGWVELGRSEGVLGRVALGTNGKIPDVALWSFFAFLKQITSSISENTWAPNRHFNSGR